MRRVIRPAALLIVFTFFSGTALRAQIRPVDPIVWRAFDGAPNVIVSVGASFLYDQPVAATGTRGRFEELARYSLTWRSGRVALTASGAAVVRLTDEEQIGERFDYVVEPHRDAGPVIVEAAARITPDNSRITGIVRFGTRLPVTSAESGLDRDETDFFATLGMRTQHRRAWVAGEGGVGIFGRPEPEPGQRDVFTYALGSGYRHNLVDADVWLVGRDDLHENALTSHEDLSELRFGIRSRGRVWLGAQWIHGLAEWSPSDGVRIAAGFDALVDRLPFLD